MTAVGARCTWQQGSTGGDVDEVADWEMNVLVFSMATMATASEGR